MKRDWRSSLGLIALTLYMIALSFALVYLLEENKALREELKAWEGLQYRTSPKKPRFYHTGR